MLIFISPRHEAGYVATFFHSFKNSCGTLVARRRTFPASCFLCGHPAATVASVKPPAEAHAEAMYSYRVWIPGHETPPWRADPILSWFSFQSSESEFSHGVSVDFSDGLVVICSRSAPATANLNRRLDLINGGLPALVGGNPQRGWERVRGVKRMSF